MPHTRPSRYPPSFPGRGKEDSGGPPVPPPKGLSPSGLPTERHADFGYQALGTRRSRLRTGTGSSTYEWIDGWATVPNGEAAAAGWAHPGMIVTREGEVLTFHSGSPTVLAFDREGRHLRSWDLGVADAHGMTLVEEDGTEFLWIADNGSKRAADLGYEYAAGSEQVSGQVLKTTLDGRTVTTLKLPDLPVYRGSRCSPTSVAVDEERFGGTGDVWVADGYGESYVHRYDKTGAYISSINGEEGSAGRFDCPHGIFINRRKGEPELYVADRANARVQVYAMDGSFKRVFGSEFLTTPSAFVTHGDQMIIAELRARLTVVDGDDNLVCYLGSNETVCDVDGWPNNRDSEGKVIQTSLLEPGKFNSTHGMAVDGDGNL